MRDASRLAAVAALAVAVCVAGARGECPGDANGDFQVDVEDLSLVITSWGTQGPEGDVNRDGIVNISDLTEVILAWGEPCAVCDTGQIEDEPCGADSNGGCNSTPPIFSMAECGQEWCSEAWADGGTRDTDWYLFQFDGGMLSATLTSSFPATAFFVDLPNFDCVALAYYGPVAYSDDGGPDTITIEVPAGQYAVFVAPGLPNGGVFDSLPCDAGPHSYSLLINCATP